MKIGIITHFWVANFGANLQALSTFYFLKKLGHEPIMLNYRPHNLEDHGVSTIRRDQLEMHSNFVSEYLVQSPVLRDDGDLVDYCNKVHFDVIVAGSDSILRIKNSVKTEDGKFPNSFWLLWTSKLEEPRPKIAYLAASTEGSFYPLLNRKTKKGIRQALRGVDYISVRDRWSKTMLKYVSSGAVNPEICPDPVSVLNDVFSIPVKYEAEAKSKHKQYVLLTASTKYFSKSWVKKFRKILQSRGLSLYTLPTPGREFEFDVDRVLQLPMHPLTWYSWIKNAKAIVTSQFHPLACSLFNEVPFISIDISGKMYFRSFGIRHTSKAHDICMNAKAESSSYLPMPARFFLSPEHAVDLFDNWDSKSAESYRHFARGKYAQTIHEVLTLAI